MPSTRAARPLRRRSVLPLSRHHPSRTFLRCPPPRHRTPPFSSCTSSAKVRSTASSDSSRRGGHVNQGAWRSSIRVPVPMLESQTRGRTSWFEAKGRARVASRTEMRGASRTGRARVGSDSCVFVVLVQEKHRRAEDKARNPGRFPPRPAPETPATLPQHPSLRPARAAPPCRRCVDARAAPASKEAKNRKRLGVESADLVREHGVRSTGSGDGVCGVDGVQWRIPPSCCASDGKGRETRGRRDEAKGSCGERGDQLAPRIYEGRGRRTCDSQRRAGPRSSGEEPGRRQQGR